MIRRSRCRDASGTPVFLIGPHRSGTTWMGHMFRRAPEVAYWGEPRHVWECGHRWRPDDVLTEADATPRIVRRIRRRFETYVRKSGGRRLCEKSPSNCLRLPFVRAVFPDARILFIIRDGRSVLSSIQHIMNRGIPAQRLAMRIKKRIKEITLADVPGLACRMGSMLSGLGGRRIRYWGPRPPGWKEWCRTDPQEVVLAKQWAQTAARALDDLGKMDPAEYYQVRYEDLAQGPVDVMKGVLRYVELTHQEPILRYAAESADPKRVARWQDTLDPELLERVRPHMEQVMHRLGYAW